MEYFYLACLLVSIGMLVWLKLFDVRNSIAQYLNLIIVIISSFGYFFLSISRTIGEAIISQIIGYVGGVFLPVFFFFLVLEICHLELSRYLKIVLVLCQCGIYGSVCTIGRNELFYKSVEMHKNNGMVVLERSYGPFHILAIGSMYLYLLLAFAVVIYALIKKKSVDTQNAITMIVLMTLATGVYTLEKILGIEYTVIPLAFDVLMLGALIPIYDSNIFTVYENTNIIDEQLGNVGFLTFDKNKAYKGCNNYMGNIFPELLQYKLEQTIKESSLDLQSLIDKIDNIEEIYRSNSKKEHIYITIESFIHNDRYYDGKIYLLTNSFGKLKGYTIELRDNTEHYKALTLRERYNEELAQEVDKKARQIETIQEKIILGMAQMVESRDLSTGGHIKRTSDVVRIFAKKLVDADLGLSPQFLNLVIRSAPMHDLGKIGVDDAVLRKQGKFTDEEYDKMKKHSEIGYHMVKEILSEVEAPNFVRVAENVAHYHHEKVNGMGYPDGLKGDEIPVEARIMALADVFDALVSKRCYKDAFSYERAYEIIEKDAGTHFDEKLATVFLSCKEELEKYYNESEK
ncbi:MAG: HD domain-containing protein [Lachnospiraceae bacterium]|nr:HD domain-containing protein [Candidatus Colinaster scatohippi]